MIKKSVGFERASDVQAIVYSVKDDLQFLSY